MTDDTFGICSDCGREVPVANGKVVAHDAFAIHAPRALVRCLGKGKPPVVDTAARIDVLRSEVRKLRGQLSAATGSMKELALTCEATVAAVNHLMLKEPATPERGSRLSAVMLQLGMASHSALRYALGNSDAETKRISDTAQSNARGIVANAVEQRRHLNQAAAEARALSEQG